MKRTSVSSKLSQSQPLLLVETNSTLVKAAIEISGFIDRINPFSRPDPGYALVYADDDEDNCLLEDEQNSAHMHSLSSSSCSLEFRVEPDSVQCEDKTPLQGFATVLKDAKRKFCSLFKSRPSIPAEQLLNNLNVLSNDDDCLEWSDWSYPEDPIILTNDDKSEDIPIQLPEPVKHEVMSIQELADLADARESADADSPAYSVIAAMHNPGSQHKDARFNKLNRLKGTPLFEKLKCRTPTRQTKRSALVDQALSDLRAKAMSVRETNRMHKEEARELRDVVKISKDPEMSEHLNPEIIITPPDPPPPAPSDPPIDPVPAPPAPAVSEPVDFGVALPTLVWSSEQIKPPASGCAYPLAWICSFFTPKIGKGTINNFRPVRNALTDLRTDVEQHTKLLHGTTEFEYDYTAEVAYNTLFGSLTYPDNSVAMPKSSFVASSELLHQASTHANIGIHVDVEESRERLTRALHNITTVNVDRAHSSTLTVRDGTQIFLEAQKLAQQSELRQRGLFQYSSLQTDTTPTGIVLERSSLQIFQQSRPRPKSCGSQTSTFGGRGPRC